MSENHERKRRVYGFSGQYGAGKDHVARVAGLLRLSQAEPMHAVSHACIGSADKSHPGVREFQQKLGVWLRGEATALAPYGVERAVVFGWLRQQLEGDGGEWYELLRGAGFPRGFDPHSGSHVDLIMELVTQRVLVAPPGEGVAITSMRYASEFAYLSRHPDLYFIHVHVHAGSELLPRRRALGYPEVDFHRSPHPTEQLAIDIDAGVAPGPEYILDNTQHSAPIVGVYNAKKKNWFNSVVVYNCEQYPRKTPDPKIIGKSFDGPAEFAAWVRAGGVFE